VAGTVVSTPATEHLGAFRCPKCGNDGSRGELRFLEDIVCYRPIIGLKNGVLEIDGLYRTDGYDDGIKARFECLVCRRATGRTTCVATNGQCRRGSTSASTGSDSEEVHMHGTSSLFFRSPFEAIGSKAPQVRLHHEPD